MEGLEIRRWMGTEFPCRRKTSREWKSDGYFAISTWLLPELLEGKYKFPLLKPTTDFD